MHWGHTIQGRDEKVEVTRAEYNASFGVESPEPPLVPEAVTHVWEWWWKLNARRAPSMDGVAPLSYSDIFHWTALTRTQITASEVGMMIQMDDAYLQAIATERKEQRDRDR